MSQPITSHQVNSQQVISHPTNLQKADAAKNEDTNEPVNKVWLAVVAGLLIATSNTWLFHPQLKHSTYSAPWVYPGNEPGQS